MRIGCIHGIGHGASDEKGTRIGMTCSKDGKECEEQCLKSAHEVLISDEDVIGLANRLQTRIEHTGYAVPEHRADDELIVRILRDYVDKRRVAVGRKEGEDDIDFPQSFSDETPKPEPKDGVGDKCIRANFGGPGVPKQIEGRKFRAYDEQDVLCYAEEIRKGKDYSDKDVNLYLAERMAKRSIINKEEADRQLRITLNTDMRWIGAESRLSKVVLGLEQFYYSIDQRWTQKTVAKSDCMHFARQRVKELINLTTRGKMEVGT